MVPHPPPGTVPRIDAFDLEVFIRNDRLAVRILVWGFLLMLAAGTGLMVAAQQAWVPLDESLARPAATLAGACMAGLGGWPLMRILDRMETIRIMRRVQATRVAISAGAEADPDAARALEDIVRRVYEKRMMG